MPFKSAQCKLEQYTYIYIYLYFFFKLLHLSFLASTLSGPPQKCELAAKTTSFRKLKTHERTTLNVLKIEEANCTQRQGKNAIHLSPISIRTPNYHGF